MQYDEAPVQSTMQRRRDAFKSTATRSLDRYAGSRAAKSKAYGRGRKKSARRAKRSLPQALTPFHYTLNKANPAANFYSRVITMRNANYFVGGGTAYGATSVFNLSGVIPKTGIQANMTNTPSSTSAITELTHLQSLFSVYKIRKVKVTFRARSTEFTDATQWPEMMYRYNYDVNRMISTGGGPQQLDSSTNIQVHKFTNESPLVTATVYPKIQAPTYAYTGVTADGYALGPTESPWIDLSAASAHGGGADVPYWGLDYYFLQIPSGQTIDVDVELTIDFKWQH